MFQNMTLMAIFAACLVAIFFCKINIVALSFVFDKYYPITSSYFCLY